MSIIGNNWNDIIYAQCLGYFNINQSGERRVVCFGSYSRELQFGSRNTIMSTLLPGVSFLLAAFLVMETGASGGPLVLKSDA